MMKEASDHIDGGDGRNDESQGDQKGNEAVDDTEQGEDAADETPGDDDDSLADAGKSRRQRQAGGIEVERVDRPDRSEEHTSELQSLMRISYAVFCLKKKIDNEVL